MTHTHISGGGISYVHKLVSVPPDPGMCHKIRSKNELKLIQPYDKELNKEVIQHKGRKERKEGRERSGEERRGEEEKEEQEERKKKREKKRKRREEIMEGERRLEKRN